MKLHNNKAPFECSIRIPPVPPWQTAPRAKKGEWSKWEERENWLNVSEKIIFLDLLPFIRCLIEFARCVCCVAAFFYSINFVCLFQVFSLIDSRIDCCALWLSLILLHLFFIIGCRTDTICLVICWCEKGNETGGVKWEIQSHKRVGGTSPCGQKRRQWKFQVSLSCRLIITQFEHDPILIDRMTFVNLYIT